MTFGIIVEAPADADAYANLITKIRPEVDRVIRRPCGGKSPLFQSFVGLLKEFQSLSVGKALVIRDSDCQDPRLIENRMEQKFRESGVQTGFPVHFHATSCMLETWLLAVDDAVNSVARQRGKNRTAQPIAGQLEGRRDSKTLFRRMLSEAQLPADPAVYAEIAAAANLERIRQRCACFQQFIERVHAC